MSGQIIPLETLDAPRNRGDFVKESPRASPSSDPSARHDKTNSKTSYRRKGDLVMDEYMNLSLEQLE